MTSRNSPIEATYLETLRTLDITTLFRDLITTDDSCIHESGYWFLLPSKVLVNMKILIEGYSSWWTMTKGRCGLDKLHRWSTAFLWIKCRRAQRHDWHLVVAFLVYRKTRTRKLCRKFAHVILNCSEWILLSDCALHDFEVHSDALLTWWCCSVSHGMSGSWWSRGRKSHEVVMKSSALD